MLEPLLAWQNDPEGGDEDDLSFDVDDLARDGDDYALTIAGRDSFADRSSRWRVRAHGVCGIRLDLPETASRLELVDTHPLLLAHSARRTELYVRFGPKDPSRLLGDLLLAHQRVTAGWIRFDEHLNPGYGLFSGELGGGFGQLAKGPLPLLEAYAAVARDHAMQPNLLGDTPPVRWDGSQWIEQVKPLFVLLLNASWCVAERYTCERL